MLTTRAAPGGAAPGGYGTVGPGGLTDGSGPGNSGGGSVTSGGAAAINGAGAISAGASNGAGAPQTTWTAPTTLPMPDSEAAALVVHQPETRPDNAQANDYVPSDSELAAFRSATNRYGQTPDQYNPLAKYITGRPGLTNPSTDDLIQWAAHKWGIPEDWIRAAMVTESGWHQSMLGDLAALPSSRYWVYPRAARAGHDHVYQSAGVMQVKWSPDRSVHPGTEPLRWKSTPFNLDVYAADVRYYFDGYCNWCGPGYSAGQPWSSVGAWYDPNPWKNPGAENYVRQVRNALYDRTWAQPGF